MQSVKVERTGLFKHIGQISFLCISCQTKIEPLPHIFQSLQWMKIMMGEKMLLGFSTCMNGSACMDEERDDEQTCGRRCLFTVLRVSVGDQNKEQIYKAKTSSSDVQEKLVAYAILWILWFYASLKTASIYKTLNNFKIMFNHSRQREVCWDFWGWKVSAGTKFLYVNNSMS